MKTIHSEKNFSAWKKLTRRSAFILLSSQWEIHWMIPNFPQVGIRLMSRWNYHHKPLSLLTNETKLVSVLTVSDTQYCVILSLELFHCTFYLNSVSKVCCTKGKDRHCFNSPFRTKDHQNHISVANFRRAEYSWLDLSFILVLEKIKQASTQQFWKQKVYLEQCLINEALILCHIV